MYNMYHTLTSFYNVHNSSMLEEHLHLLDAVLESVVVLCMTSGAMAVVVVPFGFAKAGFFSVCPVVLGVVATAEEGT